jgi:hypothetical protein
VADDRPGRHRATRREPLNAQPRGRQKRVTACGLSSDNHRRGLPDATF